MVAYLMARENLKRDEAVEKVGQGGRLDSVALCGNAIHRIASHCSVFPSIRFILLFPCLASLGPGPLSPPRDFPQPWFSHPAFDFREDELQSRRLAQNDETIPYAEAGKVRDSGR